MAEACRAAASRSVLVTGGNRGIGQDIARAFVDAGDRVAILSRSGDPPTGEDRPDGVLTVRADILHTGQVEKAYDEIEDRHGPVEVLVANAGIARDQLLMRMSDDDFTEVVDTNLHGTFRLVRRALGPMVQARRGRIVLVSSVVGLLGAAGQANYAASKAALVGLARSLVRELGPRGITVNVVAPGFVDAGMTQALAEQQRSRVLRQVPLGRPARPAEVAATVRFLAADEAAYISGAVIAVDGGWGMGL